MLEGGKCYGKKIYILQSEGNQVFDRENSFIFKQTNQGGSQ